MSAAFAFSWAVSASAGAPPRTAQTEWSAVGGGADNARYSALTQINSRNVARLGGVWFRELPSSTRTAPVMVAGTLYISDQTSIYALSARTGATLWTYTPQGSTPARGGVATGEGLVFSGLNDARVVALRQDTGALVWTAYVGNAPPETTPGATINAPGLVSVNPAIGIISNAPTYVNGVVTSGLSGGDAGARGKVVGIEAKSGKVLWNFQVIPELSDPAASTWPDDPGALRRGGGAVWTQGAADPELGLVYYGTGNAVPVSGGETRTGDNLFTASVIALDAHTGSLRWNFQLTHHDLWEMDVSTPLILYTARARGRERKALAALRTDGYLFLLDRETGTPVVPVEERPVPQDVRLRTAPTQPFPQGAEQLGPNCVEPETAPPDFVLGCYFDPIYVDLPNVLSPLLTARFAPMSFDPATGYFYAMGNVTPWWYRRVENPFALVVSIPPGSREYGLYAAIDSRTLKIVWQRRSPWGLARGSGALSTAGGLLFHIEADGTVEGSRARTGEVLWRFQTGFLGVGPHSMSGGVPFATYELDRRQYLVVPMGKGLWAFALNGPLQPRLAPSTPPNSYGFSGVMRTLPEDGSGEIAIAGLTPSYLGTDTGSYLDEFAFSPGRARVRAGQSFRWTNYGLQAHTIIADNGSWTTGVIGPASSVSIKIDKPGTYMYFAKEFPWAKGQLVVR